MDEVRLTLAEAAALAPLLSLARHRARQNGADLPSGLLSVLGRLEAAERVLAGAPRVVSRVAADGFPGSGSSQGEQVPPVTVAEVARRVGVTVQAVRRAASRGRLVGRLDATGWEFTDSAVSAWIESREQRVAALTAKRQERAEAGIRSETREELAQVDAAIAALEARIGPLERECDASRAVLEAANARPGGELSVWRAEDTAANAQQEIDRLVEQRRPYLDRAAVLRGRLAPAERAAMVLPRLEAAEQGYRSVAGILGRLEALIADVVALAPLSSAAGEYFSVPLALRDLARLPGSARWDNAQRQTRAALESLPARIAEARNEI